MSRTELERAEGLQAVQLRSVSGQLSLGVV